MGFRNQLATGALNASRAFGRVIGCEIVVELSEHSITTTMERPDESQRAWDKSLYKKGNVFIEGYANPIKPRVRYSPELSEPDTVDTNVEAESDDEIDESIQLIASPRYQQFMQQHIIADLLNPREQWKLIVYAVIALAGLMLINLLVTLFNSGAF